MGTLPKQIRLDFGGQRLLLCHGSPRRINEFLWETTTSNAFLRRLLAESGADAVLCTHTGLPWQRELPGGGRLVNVGVIGRPPNDGRRGGVYALLDAGPPPRAEFVRFEYDAERLAREMRDEKLPAEFAETILTGWWTTCLEILPAKERERGRH